MPGVARRSTRVHPARRQDVLYAYAEATVPKITLITRKSYGGARVWPHEQPGIGC
jgi:acetyl-CoA carboxylase carboxyltransferase component